MKTSDCTIERCLHQCPYCGRPVPEYQRPCGYCAIAENVPVEALRRILRAKDLLKKVEDRSRDAQKAKDAQDA